MLIDGEAVAELDFSGMAIRMLYHRMRLDPSRDEDIYRPEQIMPAYYALANASDARKAALRKFVKQATNICWNVTRRVKASQAIHKAINSNSEKSFIKSVLENQEDNGVNGLLDRIMAAHPLLAEHFFSGVGIEMMTADGQIMLQILDEFVARQQRPALAIHDSLVCKASDTQIALEIMQETYFRFCRFQPVIKQVF
jgi:hypothetical protein